MNEINLASKNRKLLANTIDIAIICFIGMILFIITVATNNSKFNLGILNIVVPCLLMYLFKDSIKGQSIGKWFMEIKVSDFNNQTPHYFKLALRNLFLLIPFLEFIVLFFNKNNKRIADIVCDTVVIQNPNKLTFFQKYGIGVLLFLTLFIIFTIVSLSMAR